jgi:hypothetical protein
LTGYLALAIVLRRGPICSPCSAISAEVTRKTPRGKGVEAATSQRAVIKVVIVVWPVARSRLHSWQITGGVVLVLSRRLAQREHQRLCTVRRGNAALPRSFLRLDLDPALRIELPPNSGELPDGFLIRQSVYQIALEGIGQRLIETRLLIDKTAARVVLPEVRLALTWKRHIDHLDGKSFGAQVKCEVVTDSDRVDVDYAKPGTELVQESDRLTACILSPPRAHPDDADAPLSEFADVDDGFGRSPADVYTANSGKFVG